MKPMLGINIKLRKELAMRGMILFLIVIWLSLMPGVEAQQEKNQIRQDNQRQLSDATIKAPDIDLYAHTHWVGSLAITPDGKLLASGARDDGNNIKLWSLPDG